MRAVLLVVLLATLAVADYNCQFFRFVCENQQSPINATVELVSVDLEKDTRVKHVQTLSNTLGGIWAQQAFVLNSTHVLVSENAGIIYYYDNIFWFSVYDLTSGNMVLQYNLTRGLPKHWYLVNEPTQDAEGNVYFVMGLGNPCYHVVMFEPRTGRTSVIYTSTCGLDFIDAPVLTVANGASFQMFQGTNVVHKEPRLLTLGTAAQNFKVLDEVTISNMTWNSPIDSQLMVAAAWMDTDTVQMLYYPPFDIAQNRSVFELYNVSSTSDAEKVRVGVPVEGPFQNEFQFANNDGKQWWIVTQCLNCKFSHILRISNDGSSHDLYGPFQWSIEGEEDLFIGGNVYCSSS